MLPVRNTSQKIENEKNFSSLSLDFTKCSSKKSLEPDKFQPDSNKFIPLEKLYLKNIFSPPLEKNKISCSYSSMVDDSIQSVNNTTNVSCYKRSILLPRDRAESSNSVKTDATRRGDSYFKNLFMNRCRNINGYQLHEKDRHDLPSSQEYCVTNEKKIIRELGDIASGKNKNIIDENSRLTVPIIIGKNNYLDIHATKANDNAGKKDAMIHQKYSSVSNNQFPKKWSSATTVYTSQIFRSQIEQYRQQLYSDVDYVIYPMKDPAISKREYLNAKQGSFLSALASEYTYGYTKSPTPSLCARAETRTQCKQIENSNFIKTHDSFEKARNTISNRGRLKVQINHSNKRVLEFQECLQRTSQTKSIHAVSSNVIFDRGPFTGSVNGTECTGSLSSLNIPKNFTHFTRVKSDDKILNFHDGRNILNEHSKKCQISSPDALFIPHSAWVVDAKRGSRKVSDSKTQCKTLCGTRNLSDSTLSRDKYKSEKTVKCDDLNGKTILSKRISHYSNKNDKNKQIDIHTLIQQSKNLDLPLISALCNDKTLIQQTNAFVMPKHPSLKRRPSANKSIDNSRINSSFSMSKNFNDATAHHHHQILSDKEKLKKKNPNESNSEVTRCGKKKAVVKKEVNASTTFLDSLLSIKVSKKSISKMKYPVSGMSTTQISRPQKKLSSSHVHPLGAVRTVKNHHALPVPSNRKYDLVP